MRKVEFLNKNDGDVVAISDDHAEILNQNDEIIQEMYEKIQQDYPEAFNELADHYNDSKRNLPYFRFLVVKRFIKCNFGEYDIHEIDIEDGKWHFETVNCPMRGECKMEGIVCNPQLSTSLSPRELQVLSLCALGKTAHEMADTLCISVCTVKIHVRHILQKLNKNNVKSVISWYNENKEHLDTN